MLARYFHWDGKRKWNMRNPSQQIVVCGINPVLYFAMNSTFRHRFLAMFRCEGEHTERMFIVTQALQTRRESRTRRVSQVRPVDFALVQQQYYALKKRPMTMPSIVS